MRLPQYLIRSPKTGVFSFRLAVPAKLREAVGKREIKKSLKTADPRKALVMAMRLKDDSDRLFGSLASKTGTKHQTELDLYKQSVDWLHSLGLSVLERTYPTTDAEQEEYDGRNAMADDLIDKFESGKGTGLDSYKIAALQGSLKRPEPSVRDAVNLYLQDRNGPTSRSEVDRRSFEQMVRRNERYLLVSLKGNRKLSQIGRQQGRDFRDFMAKKTDLRDSTPLRPGSINKSLQIVSAIFNHACTEWELRLTNPFKGLKLEESESVRDKRRSFTSEELAAYLAATAAMNDEARYCTILMAYTGARTAEITGLELQDVRLDVPIPHIIIRPNSTRSKLKTGAISKRLVPLIGSALAAARDAVAGRKDAEAVAPLFPRYSHGRGEDALSALQMKLIRQKLKIADPKLVAYSTRHTIKDRLRNALVAPELQDALLGHSKGQVSEGYGDGYWLPRLKEALEKAVLQTE